MGWGWGRLLAIASVCVLACACGRETQIKPLNPAQLSQGPDGSGSQKVLSAAWQVALPEPVLSIAVDPTSSKLVVSGADGLNVLSADGKILNQVPLGAQSGQPGPLLVTEDGDFYFGTSPWEGYVFRIGWDAPDERRGHGNFDDADDKKLLIDRNAALDWDDNKVLVPGSKLYAFHMRDGAITVAHDFGMPIRQIARVHSRLYIANLTDPASGSGKIMLWNPRTRESIASFDFDAPVSGVYSSRPLTVAVIQRGGNCDIEELQFSDRTRDPISMSTKTLVSFAPSPGTGCENTPLVLNPAAQQIYGYGASAFLMDIASGTKAVFSIKKADALALSQDQALVYAGDSSGVTAYRISPVSLPPLLK